MSSAACGSILREYLDGLSSGLYRSSSSFLCTCPFSLRLFLSSSRSRTRFMLEGWALFFSGDLLEDRSGMHLAGNWALGLAIHAEAMGELDTLGVRMCVRKNTGGRGSLDKRVIRVRTNRYRRVCSCDSWKALNFWKSTRFFRKCLGNLRCRPGEVPQMVSRGAGKPLCTRFKVDAVPTESKKTPTLSPALFRAGANSQAPPLRAH